MRTNAATKLPAAELGTIEQTIIVDAADLAAMLTTGSTHQIANGLKPDPYGRPTILVDALQRDDGTLELTFVTGSRHAEERQVGVAKLRIKR